MVAAKGYRFTTSRSMGAMPSRAMTASSVPRRPSRPPWIFGCSVFTRPSMISGKPVTDDTSRTGMPAAASAFAVPPVEISSTPRAANARARSVSPVLSETESSARRTGRSMCLSGPARSGRQPEFAQLLAQGAAGDAEDHRRLALVAAGVVEHGAEQGFLDLTQHHVVQPGGPVAVEAGQVVGKRALGVVAQWQVRYAAGAVLARDG